MKIFFAFGGVTALPLGLLVLILHATDPQPHISVPGLFIALLGLSLLFLSKKSLSQEVII
jgi:hypothetical protein